MSTVSPERMKELLAKMRAQKSAAENKALTETPTTALQIPTQAQVTAVSTGISYNKEQQEFISLAASGKSAILIGAAGTGKTTSMKGTIQALIQSGLAGILTDTTHKYLCDKSPGIVACAFTRRAVANLRKAMPEDMKKNCITIHKLLEYEPGYLTVIDPVTGYSRDTMRFTPTRTSTRPLSHEIKTIIIDESSMVSVELFNQLQDACPHRPQFIFLGDIQQLPPVFGSAILGYKMLELPTVELTQVYRQALESPIIRLAHRILSGKPILANEFPEWKVEGQLTLHPWKKKISSESAMITLAAFFKGAIDKEIYDIESDVILIPFNKACGTDELNAHIANHIARKAGKITHEIIAGFNKIYLTVGDKVLYDKEDALITSIAKNPKYLGKKPQAASATLDYWGCEQSAVSASNSDDNMSEEEVDFLLQVASSGDDEDRVKTASHIITLRMLGTERDVSIDTASEINSLILGYALTVHKSQGSEWRKVFCVFHNSHATMIQRELLYTAVTRAKEELYVICEPETFVNGIKSQRIKGNTLAEKAMYFRGKVDNEKQLGSAG